MKRHQRRTRYWIIMKWPCPVDYMSVWQQINLGSTQFFADRVLVSLVNKSNKWETASTNRWRWFFPKKLFFDCSVQTVQFLSFQCESRNWCFKKTNQKTTKRTTQLFLLRFSLKKGQTSKQLKKFNPKNLPSEKNLRNTQGYIMVASYQPNDCGWSYQNLPVQHTINGAVKSSFFQATSLLRYGIFQIRLLESPIFPPGGELMREMQRRQRDFFLQMSSKDVFFGKIYSFFF